MSDAAARSGLRGELFALWVLVVVVLAAAYVAAQTMRSSANVLPHVSVAGILAGAALALAWVAAAVHGSRLPRALRLALVVVLGYHALFGPALLLTRALREASSNDELVMRVWPHVVHAINALE